MICMMMRSCFSGIKEELLCSKHFPERDSHILWRLEMVFLPIHAHESVPADCFHWSKNKPDSRQL